MVMTEGCRKENKVFPGGLENFFNKAGALAVAYSGGLDSRFLCHAASAMGADVLAIHATGPHIAPEDTEYALQWAQKHGLKCLKIYINPLTLPDVANNSRRRCLACKQYLFGAIQNKLAETGEETRQICDGGNLDDLSAYRPGRLAAKNAGIVSPLALAGLNKDQIRLLGAKTGLENVGQKPRPCLLTRMAYGMEPTPALLSRLALAEGEIANLLLKENLINCDFRLRLVPAPELHLICECAKLSPHFMKILEKHGFSGAVIRRLECLSGFFDRAMVTGLPTLNDV